ncbi:hypothetical protein PLICRDRAFT_127445 [Plicaturopsis crispa FD-325 SS-3]|uniref:Unplaced genomic scaffold PLICRscaffold_45, whole genome shotgun sequence n=1 Tax=Plicaturopsis crispa FD-325 SS-3 TaxID=944288 RepID=A0A0C9T158_PLICR|nr:hypothetical protein PLICRDRAFT_127445 [Plicaturopsis crispa FD-325 SS-3]
MTQDSNNGKGKAKDSGVAPPLSLVDLLAALNISVEDIAALVAPRLTTTTTTNTLAPSPAPPTEERVADVSPDAEGSHICPLSHGSGQSVGRLGGGAVYAGHRYRHGDVGAGAQDVCAGAKGVGAGAQDVCARAQGLGAGTWVRARKMWARARRAWARKRCGRGDVGAGAQEVCAGAKGVGGQAQRAWAHARGRGELGAGVKGVGVGKRVRARGVWARRREGADGEVGVGVTDGGAWLVVCLRKRIGQLKCMAERGMAE